MSRGRVSIAILFLKQAANACEVVGKWSRMDEHTAASLLSLTKEMRAMATHLEKI